MKKTKNLIKRLNLNWLRFANTTASSGDLDMPSLYCNTNVYPDYLALYSEPSLYTKTKNTAVCFFEYDSDFDGKNGLFWAIQYDDRTRLNYFKNRFENVKIVISPDYSILGDIHVIENYHRLFRARIVSLWFLEEIGAVVIPNITFTNDKYCRLALDGLEKCSVVAISTKGHMNSIAERQRLKNNIAMTVDNLNLKAIIVYDVCGTQKNTIDIFQYAIQKGIKIVVPDNTLKIRNRDLALERLVTS